MRSRAWMAASVFVAVFVVGWAAPAEAAPAYPKANGRCVDQTGVLGHDLCAKVTAALLADERATSDEISVAVVPTTGDTDIETWSTGLFNTWGVGKKNKNNGVLLVVAVDDRKVRLETGRGIAKRLDDGDAVTVVGDITSHFAEDEYALGILAGLDDVRRRLGHTVPTGARLQALAATAPARPDPIGTDGSDENSSDDTEFTSSDGHEFASPDDFASADDDSLSVVPIAIGAFAVVALIGVLVSRGSSRSASGSGLSSSRHPTATHRSTWVAGNADVATTSSPSSFDSSGASGSSFGGGSSDGGGATGSW